MSGQAKTEIFRNDDTDTGLLSSLANVTQSTCYYIGVLEFVR